MSYWHFVAPPNEAVEKSLGIVRCGVCGRPLTDPESVAKGIGPVCAAHGVAKHMGPGAHPSGSPQSVHAGGKGGQKPGKGKTKGQTRASRVAEKKVVGLKQKFDRLVSRREAARKQIDPGKEGSANEYRRLVKEVNRAYKKLLDARYALEAFK